ncbi:Uu.00g092650.m01.CDS01 [Anthostomella pinea]|uniref:Uu.00g092650.m01.CDS01 n=1 Tax=Anthostomella pinea TaxID=933095 RepID=A0AAI8VNA5_9PEZI|nr:Uu.00g092650.m01.CDS01 [Anthostomella pinea]
MSQELESHAYHGLYWNTLYHSIVNRIRRWHPELEKLPTKPWLERSQRKEIEDKEYVGLLTKKLTELHLEEEEDHMKDSEEEDEDHVEEEDEDHVEKEDDDHAEEDVEEEDEDHVEEDDEDVEDSEEEQDDWLLPPMPVNSDYYSCHASFPPRQPRKAA